MEALNKKRLGTLGDWSEQQLVDCTKGTYGNLNGCGGGIMHYAMQYVYDNVFGGASEALRGQGLEFQPVYPQNTSVNVANMVGNNFYYWNMIFKFQYGVCKTPMPKQATDANRGYIWVKQNDEAELKRAVGLIGPVTIAMYCSLPTFKAFKGHFRPKRVF